jgi:hypothetical protein
LSNVALLIPCLRQTRRYQASFLFIQNPDDLLMIEPAAFFPPSRWETSLANLSAMSGEQFIECFIMSPRPKNPGARKNTALQSPMTMFNFSAIRGVDTEAGKG